MMQPPESRPDLSDETIGGMPTEHPHCCDHAGERAKGDVDAVPVGAEPTAVPG